MGINPAFEAIATTWRALSAQRAQPDATLVWQPAPPGAGSATRARRLAAGVWHLGGHLVEGAAGASPWDVTAAAPAWLHALHAHTWLDDFAAVERAASPAAPAPPDPRALDPRTLADDAARGRVPGVDRGGPAAASGSWREGAPAGCPGAPTRDVLRGWVWDWIDRYGGGGGPDATPDLVVRRLGRWIGHGVALMEGAAADRGRVFLRAAALQTRMLEATWSRAAPGLPRLEAAVVRLVARLGLDQDPGAAIADLGAVAAATVAPDGGLACGRADALAEAGDLLDWARRALEVGGHSPDPAHQAALDRVRSGLAALAHSDGSLPRFRGSLGGRVPIWVAHQAAGGKADVAAVEGPVPPGAADAPAVARRVVAAPGGVRRMIAPGMIVLVAPDGFEVSGEAGLLLVGAPVPDGPVGAPDAGRAGLIPGWDAPGDRHAATRAADPDRPPPPGLSLSPAGVLSGAHTSAPPVLAEGAHALADLRFLVAPDVQVRVALGGRVVVLSPPGGPAWSLAVAAGRIALSPATLVDPARLHPRPTHEIVVSGPVTGYGTVVWSLARIDAAPRS